ncbi:polysaccharide deacetylase family protein [Agrobacterium sp. ES01]|uniref:polysaccharide deacetylase family protein n=1 Tax=Agrobacterium sp. ES01 TaxID=3420714 RepID=UPI003D0F1A09
MIATLKGIAKRTAITGGLEASNLLQKFGLMSKARGRAAIFTLHHVRPYVAGKSPSNRHLEITPEFLDAAIRQLRADGYTFVSLESLPERLAEPDKGERYAVFTLDDGFRDNAEFALPVFERHQVPFTIFVCKGFSERSHTLWWETLEALVNATDAVVYEFSDGTRQFPVTNLMESWVASHAISAEITKPGEAEAVAHLNATAAKYGVDAAALCKKLIMEADALKALAQNPLVSLGAHTVSHRALAFLDAEEASQEFAASADYVEAITGKRPTTFAYPYGDHRSVTKETCKLAAEAGFSIAVSTVPGTIDAEALSSPQSLPRISLNGYFQKPRYVSALASGIPFKLKG